MVKHFIALFSAFFISLGLLSAQNDDPVLFSVEGVPVHVSEFNYIYTKTNQDKADFSKASLDEYLNLYVNFKLKVKKARDMQLDTVPETKSELEGYRRQLANSYLVDKEVTDKLVKEAYDRMQKDIDISYILVNCNPDASAADTLKAYNRAMSLLKLIKGGAAFDQVAADSSDDKAAKENRGHLGYITAMFPDGFYDMEREVYKAKIGDVVGPVRTPGGYNLVMVHGSRPARGEIEVSHILVRKGDTPEKATAAKVRIDSAYAALQSGMAWPDVCARFSEDQMTAAKGGYIGFFAINRYQRPFEDAAFDLKKDNDYSAPVETTIGWHIIQRMSLRPVGSFETLKRALTERVKRDSRSEIAKQSMISRIKKEGGYREYSEALNYWAAQQQDSVFHTFKWKADPSKPQTELFHFGKDNKYTLADFEDYCARAGRERMRGKGFPVEETIAKLYKSWSDDCAMQYEESQLEFKYPEFRSLMREYEEGILLFEAAKRLVWDRANTDSTGLEAYFNKNLKGKYMWDERADVSFYTIKSDDAKLVKKVRDYAAEKPAAEVLKKFNKKGENDVVAVLDRTYEKGKNKDLDNMWKSGTMGELKTDAGTKTASFIKVENIIPPSPKALADARGYAVADYQDYLEKQWVEELRKEYKVDVKTDVLNALVRKK